MYLTKPTPNSFYLHHFSIRGSQRGLVPFMTVERFAPRKNRQDSRAAQPIYRTLCQTGHSVTVTSVTPQSPTGAQYI